MDTFTIYDNINIINLNDIAAEKRRVLQLQQNMNTTENELPTSYQNLENNEEDVIFQVLDWNIYHDEDENGNKHYTMRLFGKTKENKSICVFVRKYTPYFYVEIPRNWRNQQIDILLQFAKKKVFPKENVDGLINHQLIEKYKFWGFTNYEKFNFLQLTFRDTESMKSYERVLKKPMKIFQINNKEDTILQLYESNLEPFLRCMHIRNLESVGWISLSKGKYNVIDESSLSTNCNINIDCEWTELNKVDDTLIMPFVIASFDIECTSEDGTFPQARRDGDKIIQIGTTFSRFGEEECFYQHIITLGSCDPLPNADVESYNTEQEVLLAWTNMITRTDPDIITGYNIFGFDFEYMKDRSTKLGIYDRFSRISRLLNEKCEFKEKKLASSALGENILKYIDTPGRIPIDMLKVAQRDHKLESYKLDFVASYFIKEKVKEFIVNEAHNTTLIKTENTYGVKEDNYVTIYYTDGITNNKHMDGKKFKILELTKKSLLVNGKIDTDVMGKGFKVFWCQAKDDISPKDIFRLQKGTSTDRAIIAKYCLMDCILCNKLINKLQVLTNNIGMANVCNVPLSYIFMRGQGIKIYSLVAKKCREKQHLIPTFHKEFKSPEEEEEAKKEERKIEKLIAHLNGDDTEGDADEEEGYEGAIVFPPEPGVYYEPIPVLDYSSLYPSSMIHKNLSHESYVFPDVENDAKYGNLPGYKYYITSYVTTVVKQQYDRKLLNSLIKAYNENKEYLVDELEADPSKHRRVIKVYDKDHNLNKRYLIADIKADRTHIIITNYKTSKFAEKEDGTKGIIPEILTDLLTARKKYKNIMEKEEDAFKKSIYDGLQAAYKVTANSLYGQTGSSFSAIRMKEIAETTTATGREMLCFSKEFIETKYGKLVNLALTDKAKYIEFCNELFKDVVAKKWNNPYKEGFPPRDSPEYDYRNYWTSKNEFIEHFSSKMNETLKGKSVNPYIVYGDSVTKDTPILLRTVDTYKIKIMPISEIGNQWESYEQFKPNDLGLTDKQQDTDSINNYEVWSDKGWVKINKVIRHKTNKKIYEVMTNTGYVQVTEDHSLLTKTGEEIKPLQCDSTTELLHAFPQFNIPSEKKSDKFTMGTNNAKAYAIYHKSKPFDENLLNATYIEKIAYLKSYIKTYGVPYTTTDQTIALGFYYIVRSLGYNASIKIVHNPPYAKHFSISFKMEPINNETKLVSINELVGYNDYVYDLETANGHFHAGVGQMIVHNTDSVFFNAQIKDNITGELGKDKEALAQAIQLGIWASNAICLVLPSVQAQAYEKVLWPFMILTKKRYVGNLYEKDPNEFKQKSMGIVLKRRDNANIVKIVCGGIVDQILNRHDSIGAVKLTKRLLKDILSGKYPMDKFIITKTLREHYANRLAMPHAVLADRMAARDPGNKPMSNDRIPYAFIQVDHEVELQGERVESPDYIINNKLKLDYLYYITNQIQKPAVQFLELIVENPVKIFESYIIRENNRRAGIAPIKKFFTDQNKNIDDEYNDIINNNTNNIDDENSMGIDEISQEIVLDIKKKIPSRSKTLKKLSKKDIMFVPDESMNLD